MVYGQLERRRFCRPVRRVAIVIAVATALLIAVAIVRVVWVVGRRAKAAAPFIGEIVKCGKYYNYVRYKVWIFKVSHSQHKSCILGRRVLIINFKLDSSSFPYTIGKATAEYLDDYNFRFKLVNLLQIRKNLNQFYNVLQNKLGKNKANMLMAMLFGDKYLTSPIYKAFKSKGLAHVSAVSGYNVAIFLAIVSNLFIFIGKRQKYWFDLLFIILFGLVVGSAIPVKRAQIGAILCKIEAFFRGRCNLLNNVFFTLLIHIILSPADVFSLSFQLTYMALFGIIVSNFLQQKIKNSLLQNLVSLAVINMLTSLVLLIHGLIPINPIVALFWNFVAGDLIDIIVVLGYWDFFMFWILKDRYTVIFILPLEFILNILSFVLGITF